MRVRMREGVVSVCLRGCFDLDLYAYGRGFDLNSKG